MTHFAFESKGNLSEFKLKNITKHTLDIIKNIEKQILVYCSETGLEGLKSNDQTISADYFRQLSEQVCLSFLPHNKECFSVEESVELFLEIKNIKKLDIKVFEFNTLTYYRKTMAPFNSSIDLDGLESEHK